MAGQQGGASARRLLFVVNNPAFFLSHRLPLAQRAREEGFDVHVATMDGPSVARIVSLGFEHHALPMSRSGKNPLQEMRSVYALWALFRRLRPQVVHAVTIKPVLYGGIAARLAGVPAYVAAISGLGFIFTRPAGGVDFLRMAATLLYRLALGHRNSRVIFQNANDRDVLSKAGVVRPEQVVLIRGSGVDLNEFQARPEPDRPPVAIMAARLLHDKGVREFVEAARMTASDPSGLRWVLAGSPDPGNPASISMEQFESWRQEGVVQCLGERSDIAGLYGDAHIVVLPSYREGLPKSLVEAAACGRAVVTTDVPGCRDAIEPDMSGLLVPARDARALAQAVLRLAGDGDLRRKMGAEGRRLAEREFDIGQVAQAHLDIYQTLVDGS
ncbi:MAG: glycosyltransferase family 4 protein [Burkholderiaceae bacterium]